MKKIENKAKMINESSACFFRSQIIDFIEIILGMRG